MEAMLPYLIFIPVSYLLGAVPFGFLIARARGIDIRTVGSGNIGATNVLRSVGKSWGVLALVLDALKGLVPAAVFPVLASMAFDMEAGATLRLCCGCAAVIGHNYPVYLKFKGGKGVATTAGALIGIAPLALLCGLAMFAVVFGASRMVALGSISAAIVIPIVAWVLYYEQGKLVPIVLTVLGILAIWRHRANIGRILNGKENRIEFGKKKLRKT
jgi:acyl phosphate:glycerol-3-phosphate acyltransferase